MRELSVQHSRYSLTQSSAKIIQITCVGLPCRAFTYRAGVRICLAQLSINTSDKGAFLVQSFQSNPGLVPLQISLLKSVLTDCIQSYSWRHWVERRGVRTMFQPVPLTTNGQFYISICVQNEQTTYNMLISGLQRCWLLSLGQANQFLSPALYLRHRQVSG